MLINYAVFEPGETVHGDYLVFAIGGADVFSLRSLSMRVSAEAVRDAMVDVIGIAKKQLKKGLEAHG